MLMRWISKTRKHLNKRRVKVAVFGVPVFTLGVVVYISINAMHSPAVGTVKQVSAQQATKHAQAVEVDGFHNGKLINFSYPPGYTRLKQKLSGNYLEVVGLGGPRKANRQITVGVSRDSLENNSGIVFRRQHMDIYKEEKLKAGGVVFTSSKSGYERMAFIEHEDMLASVAVVSPSGYDMKEVSDQIIESLEWN